jgi:hypothetical protein
MSWVTVRKVFSKLFKLFFQVHEICRLARNTSTGVGKTMKIMASAQVFVVEFDGVKEPTQVITGELKSKVHESR